MYNIKTLNKISDVGLKALDKERYNIQDEMTNPDAILVRSAKMHDYDFNPELLCIARAGAGTNNIPLERCSEEGIVVFNTPGANAESVKELVICAMLLANRDILGGIDWVKSAASDPELATKVEKEKARFAGPEIFGKTLGIVGLGAIGYKLANAAVELGMEVYGYDPYLSVESAWRLSSKVKYAESIEAIYRQSDYISLHVPATDATLGMVNEASIAQMKDGVKIINLARAELVNDTDIVKALESGKVGCYVTDFPTPQVAAAKGVIAVPHLGASTPESEDNCAIMAAEEVREYLEHGNIRNSVNMPAAYMEPSSHLRVCFTHHNIPGVIKGLLQVIADGGLNVENMVNKSRDKYSYGIVDVSGTLSAECIEKMKQVEGMIRVRVIG